MSATGFLTQWLDPDGGAGRRDSAILGDPEAAVIELLRNRLDVTDEMTLFAAGLAVLAHRYGHATVDLDGFADLVAQRRADLGEAASLPPSPTSAELIAALRGNTNVVREISVLPTVADAMRDARPLVLVDHYLYSHRQFVDELSIARQLTHRASAVRRPLGDTSLLDRIVPVPSADDEEAKKCGDTGIANRAARSVLTSRLTVLTGGPGTGKTYTLTRCLALLLADRFETRGSLDSLSVALVAPTGKAATRATELLSQFVTGERERSDSASNFPTVVLDKLYAIKPTTIQRLLGSSRRRRTRFTHDADNPLTHDIVVVDEMSMVSTSLMARLLEAIHPDATVLLVGDQAQLESVESGSVLRGIVSAEPDNTPVLADSVFDLRRVWRQQGDTQISELASLIRSGSVSEASQLLQADPAGITRVETIGAARVPGGPVDVLLATMRTVRDLATSTEMAQHAAAYSLLAQHRVLCGPRVGPQGVSTWNDLIRTAVHGSLDAGWYVAGTPLLVTVNSPRVNLVNGDVGLVVTTTDDTGAAVLRVYFPNGQGPGRYLATAELPPHEPCYAMTVHKSQGSEYGNVLLIMPSPKSPLLTRELIYTAVTRAKSSLVIVGDLDSITAAIERQSVRVSGLSALIARCRPN